MTAGPRQRSLWRNCGNFREAESMPFLGLDSDGSYWVRKK
jgi:hypothetical protein